MQPRKTREQSVIQLHAGFMSSPSHSDVNASFFKASMDNLFKYHSQRYTYKNNDSRYKPGIH